MLIATAIELSKTEQQYVSILILIQLSDVKQVWRWFVGLAVINN